MKVSLIMIRAGNHFVATLNLHFGTTGLGVVHVLLLLSTLCSFLLFHLLRSGP